MRVILPSCAVKKIRASFPSASFAGFKYPQLSVDSEHEVGIVLGLDAAKGFGTPDCMPILNVFLGWQGKSHWTPTSTCSGLMST